MMIHDVLRGSKKAREAFDDMDVAAVEAVTHAVAVGLFSLQMSGLIRFPSGKTEPLTIGEIDSALDRAVACAVQKFLESADQVN